MIQGQNLEQEIKNVSAFTKLYGYVRYFYPSDEVQQIDWNRFILYANSIIYNQPNDSSLLIALQRLFYPIAPAIKIFNTKNNVAFDIKDITPDNVNEFKTASWQYLGINLSIDKNSVYKNIRLNRPESFSEENNSLDTSNLFGPLKYLSANQIRGKEVTLTVWMNNNLPSDTNTIAGIFINSFIDTVNYKWGEPHYNEYKIAGNRWTKYSFSAHVDNSAEKILLGVYLKNKGNINIDNIKLTIDSENVSMPLENYSFENSQQFFNQIPSWETTGNNNYEWSLTKQSSQERRICLNIYSVDTPSFISRFPAPLFDKYNRIGSYVRKDLSPALSCIIPLALYCTKEYTYPKVDSVSFKNVTSLYSYFTKVYPVTIDSLYTRLANIEIMWTIYKHFFPYWDDVLISPDTLLWHAIAKTFSDKTQTDFLETLRLMDAPLNDGHIFTELYGDENMQASEPIVFDSAENKIIVKAVLDSSLKKDINAGDIVDSIEGKGAIQYLLYNESFLSGSPQYNRARSLMRFSNGRNDELFHITINHAGSKKSLSVKRSRASVYYSSGNTYPSPPKSSYIKPNVYYLNYGDNIPTEEDGTKIINALLDTANKLIIIDLRCYPSFYKNDITLKLFSLLLTKPDTAHYFFTPKIILPDYQQVSSYDGSGWNLYPEKAHINAKVIFLEDATTVSAMESFLGIIKAYKLGTIVGQASAGANGNLNSFPLFDNYSSSFSGMRVMLPNGEKQHIVGIIPDIYVPYTIDGITKNKDEILEKALELAK